MLIKNAIIHTVASTLFILSGVLGVFAAMGLCVALWGPAVLDTALAKPPDRTHPAFWMFMLLMVPAMIVGSVGGIFTFVVPLYAFFDVQVFKGGAIDQRWCDLYIRLLRQIHTRSWPDPPPAEEI